MYERDFFGQQVFEAALYDGVGLAAADFHDRPRAGNLLPDRGREFLGGFGIAIFTEEFHQAPLSPRPSARGIRRRAWLRPRQSR